MTPQTIAGLFLTLGGLAGLIASLALKLDVAAIAAASGVMSSGTALLGKELWPGSPQSLAAKSHSIPPKAGTTLLVLPLLFLLGCGAAGYDPKDARDAANSFRVTLNEAGDAVAIAGGGIDFVCAYYGASSSECTRLEDGYEVARKALLTAHAAVDMLDATGVAVAGIADQVRAIGEQAKVFGAAVRLLGEGVQDVLADRSVPQDAGAADAQPAEGPAAAEGAAASPAAAP